MEEVPSVAVEFVNIDFPWFNWKFGYSFKKKKKKTLLFIRKKSDDRILRKEFKEQHISAVSKSYSYIIYIYIYTRVCVIFVWGCT